jgi:lysosomal acid lipase/cholesteryl ester hydrolase/gastric triacylglycerol lipase
MMRSGLSHAMRAYDYGTRCRTVLDLPRPCNQRVYGQETPPAYNLSAMTTPLGIFTGGHRWRWRPCAP